MKTFVLLFVLGALACTLAACETTTHDTSSAAQRGTTLGDSNVHVSGYTQAGGTISNR